MNDSTSLSGVQRISGPAELLQAVPYLLGFHPQHSVVLVGLRRGTLVVTARLDIADAHIAEMLDGTVASLARGGSTELVAVVYSDADLDVDGPTKLAAKVREAAVRGGAECIEVLHVGHGRWRSLLCSYDGCCPSDGRPLPTDVSAFAAAATYSGVVPLPSRAALEGTFEPLPAAERALMAPALAQAEDDAIAASLDGQQSKYERSVKRALFAAARSFGNVEHARASKIDDEAAARFGVALRAIPVRDSLWLAVDDRRLDGRPLWRELARRLPSPYDACPAFLYGWASWRIGNGAVAGMAAERAVASDPDFTPAVVLLGALAHGAGPRELPRLRPSRSA